MSDLDGLLDSLEGLSVHDLRYQVKVFRAIKAWAIKQCCDFTDGDRVEMTGTLDMDTLHGWASYAEVMAAGSTATVQRIDFNDWFGYWYADIIFDREWSAAAGFGSKSERRYWHGPVDQTPDGYEPPTPYDQEHHPNGRKHTFAMPVKYLRKEQS